MGLMSGTSLDGIDVSIIKSDGYKEYSTELDRYFEYDKELVQKLLEIRDKILNSEDLGRYFSEIKDLEREVTLFHYKAANETIEKFNSNIEIEILTAYIRKFKKENVSCTTGEYYKSFDMKTLDTTGRLNLTIVPGVSHDDWTGNVDIITSKKYVLPRCT